MRTLMARLVLGGSFALFSCGGGASGNAGALVKSVGEVCSNAPPCGACLLALDTECVYSNGPDQCSANSCAGEGMYGPQYQSVEFVQRYFAHTFGTPNIWDGNGTDLCSVTVPGLTVQWPVAGYVPLHGDAMVVDMGNYGRTGIVDNCNGESCSVVEQNADVSGRSTYPLLLEKCFIHANPISAR